MRELTAFEDEATARKLGEVLSGGEIEAEVRQGNDGSWRVWVVDEDKLDRAREALEGFREHPESPEHERLIERARSRRKEQAEQEASRPRVIRLRERWQAANLGRVTLGLIAISVVVAVITRLGDNNSVTRYFTIAGYIVDGDLIRWSQWEDLLSGQVWRLVTPIFVHFGVLHILFNMLWLKDLGSAIERLQSSLFLVLFVLVTAVLSNLVQYLVPPSSPLFGGMSGVVYGLLAYIWIRGRFDPASGYGLDRRTLIWMLAWLVICFTGLVGAVANGAHVAGLVVGAAWGFLASGRGRRRSSKR
jgi:GlpG protein